MASFLDKLKAHTDSHTYMQPFRNVSIYPKILEKKYKFSQEEKDLLIKKRWYVYFDYLNPDTGKFKRQTPITANLNREYRDFDARLEAFKTLKSELTAYLKAGNSPYKKKSEGKYTIIDALDFALEEKKKSNISKRTIEGYEKSVNKFKTWIKQTGKSNLPITETTPPLITQFIASLKVSNRTKNNYRGDLSAVFALLSKQGYISVNPVEKVDKEEAKTQIDFDYSEKDFQTVNEFLEKEDPVLLMFIRLVSYQFWRPKENCRIKRKDIDLDKKTVKAFVKQGKVKTKLIPDILFKDLQEYLKDVSREDLIFTPTGPGKWDRDLDGRRSFFTLKFKRIRDFQGWNKDITIYSFRHFFITKAYKNILTETGSHEKTVSILSKMTGHTSKAINVYIHDRDISLPEDYSEYLK